MSFELFDLVSQGLDFGLFGSLSFVMILVILFFVFMLAVRDVPKAVGLTLLIPVLYVAKNSLGWIWVVGIIILGILFAGALTRLFGQQY